MKIVDDLKKEYGEHVYMASEAPKIEVVSSGSLTLDFATGVGGYPRGGVVEVYGRNTVGKTSLSYYAISEAQKQGHYCAFINLEGVFDPDWAERIAGIKKEDLLVAAPTPGAEAVQLLTKLVNSGVFGLIVFDSVGAMLTQGEQEEIKEEKGKFKVNKQAGGQSALVTHMVKQIGIPSCRNKTTVIFLNQVRDVFSTMFSYSDSPGGHALKHFAAMRIELKNAKGGKKERQGEQEVEIMKRVTATLKKNKVSAPNRVAAWNFWNVPSDQGVVGIDRDQEVIDMAFNLGIIDQKGSIYYHPLFPSEWIKGKDNVADHIRSDPELSEAIRKEVLTHAAGSTIVEDLSDDS